MMLALQIALLVVWYLVPAAEALPWWLIFLPLIVFFSKWALVVIGLMLAVGEKR